MLGSIKYARYVLAIRYYWIALYVSDVFMHMNPTKDDIQISHTYQSFQRSAPKKRNAFYFHYSYSFCCWCLSYCVSYVPLLLYIWWISVKSIVQLSVLERKMCNVISYNNSSRQCYFYLYSKCIFLLSDIIFSTKILKKIP